MFVIIVGGGRTGSRLAKLLLEAGHEVKVIEQRPSLVERMAPELPSGAIVVGDGSSPSVLEAAGVTRASALAAVTREDETNLVVTTLARFEFNVPRVIARVNNPLNAWLYNKDMGVDVAFDQAELMTRLIEEEILLGDMVTVLKLRHGEVSLVRKTVRPDSPVVGRTLRELSFPQDCTLAAVMRGDAVIVPNGETRLAAGDEVLAVARDERLPQLAALFGHEV